MELSIGNAVYWRAEECSHTAHFLKVRDEKRDNYSLSIIYARTSPSQNI